MPSNFMSHAPDEWREEAGPEGTDAGEHTRLIARTLIERGLLTEWQHQNLRQGRLNGTADLTVTVKDGETSTSGEGYGEVRLLPVLPPLKIHMRADGRGYTFDVGL